MKYKELVSISGLSGLYQLLSTKSDGAIVKNLDDGKTKFIPARLHQVTPLDSIEVFTKSDNVFLSEVFLSMEKNEKKAKTYDVPKNDTKAIAKAFATGFPEYDEERVYASDMKKILKWYTIVKNLDLLKSLAEQAKEEIVEEEK